eukprot:XP_008646950.2 polygalacturonate 4-alpha-galacturonosyltransferase [Zea mays]
MEVVQQDDEALVKLENTGIERSKDVDSAVLGKYSIWRRENENEKADSRVRLMRDQMIMARIYSVLAKYRDKLDLYQELLARLNESQRSLGEATADAELPKSASDRIKAMGQVLSKARDLLYDCKEITQRLRAMLQSADEQVWSLKKQSTFLSQLAAKTIPNGIHCLSMHLRIDYYLLSPEKRKFPSSENLENPDLYHYALLSNNVLAASVAVNSTIMNAKATILTTKEARTITAATAKPLVHAKYQKGGQTQVDETSKKLMDVVTAYLYGSLDSDIYMKVPDGIDVPNPKAKRNISVSEVRGSEPGTH